jgi:hypothetical protein
MSTHVANDVAPNLTLKAVCMAGKPPNSRWDVYCENGVIASLEEHKPLRADQESGTRFLSPSLCHPHIHLDKVRLFSYKFAIFCYENREPRSRRRSHHGSFVSVQEA